jgi:hypothetical protein
MKCSALALVAVATVAAAAAGDAPASPYDCGTAASPCKPCNRTFRIGAPRLAAPAALGIMGKSLDFLDACFAFYDQPSGVNYIPGAVQSSQSTDCSKAGGETATTNPDCFHGHVQSTQQGKIIGERK